MAKDDRLVEFKAEMLIKQDEMVAEFRNVKTEVSGDKKEAKNMNEEIIKLNYFSAENNRAILKLANQLKYFLDLGPSVKKLKSAVFK